MVLTVSRKHIPFFVVRTKETLKHQRIYLNDNIVLA